MQWSDNEMGLMPSMVVEHWRGGKWSSGAGGVVVGSVAVAVLVVLFRGVGGWCGWQVTEEVRSRWIRDLKSLRRNYYNSDVVQFLNFR